MWHIHGKRYDLINFLDHHPGGRAILEACKGDQDCTATFESYHTFCNMSKIQRLMKTYEIPKTTQPDIKEITPLHSFEPQGFYRTVQNKVRLYFTKNKIDHYANTFWLVKIIAQILLYIIFSYIAFFSIVHYWLRIMFAALAGHMLVQWGFTVMHDASHNAISKSPIINNILCRVWNSIGLWDSSLWMIHHVYRHHTFTAIHKLDPDTIHLRPFLKKIESDPNNKYISFLLKYPKITTIISSAFLPGLYIGQAFAYHAMWILRGRLWYMSLVYHTNVWDILLKLLTLFTFYTSGSFLIVYTYIVLANVSYFVCIMPDHDMFETAQVKIDDVTKKYDWGEFQVRNSGNFATSNRLVTECFGGINYQIEHHLFPSVCHVHYPAIAPIVKSVCSDFDIPYTDLNTVMDAVKSILRNFETISKS